MTTSATSSPYTLPVRSSGPQEPFDPDLSYGSDSTTFTGSGSAASVSSHVQRVYKATMPERPQEPGSSFVKSLMPKRVYQMAVDGLLPMAQCSAHAPSEENLDKNRAELLSNLGGDIISFYSANNNKIDGYIHRQPSDKAVLYIGGRNTPYEWNEPRLKPLQDLGITVLNVNPGGVGRSTIAGKPTADSLTVDLFSAFQYLVDHEHYEPEKILIWGYSLGGSLSATTAALIEKEYPKISSRCLIEQTFKNTASIAAQSTGTGFIGTAASYAIGKVGFDLDTHASFNSLRGERAFVYHPEDAVSHSFHDVIPAYRQNNQINVIELSETYSPEYPELLKGGLNQLLDSLNTESAISHLRHFCETLANETLTPSADLQAIISSPIDKQSFWDDLQQDQDKRSAFIGHFKSLLNTPEAVSALGKAWKSSSLLTSYNELVLNQIPERRPHEKTDHYPLEETMIFNAARKLLGLPLTA